MSDENCYKMMEHYAGFVEQLTAAHLRAESRVGTEAAYQKSVETLLGEDNCFKIIFVSHHSNFIQFSIISHECCKLLGYVYIPSSPCLAIAAPIVQVVSFDFLYIYV